MKPINHLILMGRLTKDPEIQKLDGKNVCHITLAVKRPWKNSDGIYEADYITCTVWNIIAERVCDYCKKGDLVSLKGRVQSNNYTKEDIKVYSYEIVADQISFMQSQNVKNKEDLVSVQNA